MSERPDSGVRRAEAADAPVVGEMLDAFNREYGEPTPGPEALADRMGELIAGGETLVLLVGSGPEGIAVLRFRLSIWAEGEECYLAELHVKPEHRGKGFGRALVESAIDAARRRGAGWIDLNTSEDDVEARSLYESLGFVNREGGPDGPVCFYYELDL